MFTAPCTWFMYYTGSKSLVPISLETGKTCISKWVNAESYLPKCITMQLRAKKRVKWQTQKMFYASWCAICKIIPVKCCKLEEISFMILFMCRLDCLPMFYISESLQITHLCWFLYQSFGMFPQRHLEHLQPHSLKINSLNIVLPYCEVRKEWCGCARLEFLECIVHSHSWGFVFVEIILLYDANHIS